MTSRTILRAAAAVALLIVTACGGGDDEPPAEVGSVTAGDAPTPEDDGGGGAGDGGAGETAGEGAEQDGAGDEEDAQPPLVLVMDASGSMATEDGEGRTLLDGAKDALGEVVAALPDGTPTGLVVYGHRVPNTDEANGCRDTELIHPVEPLDREAMTAAIEGFEARGFTPIGRALQEAAAALPPEGERSIVLVSDGEDTCTPPDPCQVAEDLRAEGVNLIVNTIGFALGDDEAAREQLQCIAEAGGGEFRDAEDAADLAETLADVSVRDRREAELEGSVLEGAALPRDAGVGEVDTSYTDTVLADETNYYGFAFEPGTEVTAEVILTALDVATDGCSNTGLAEVDLTDAGGEPYRFGSVWFPNPGETDMVHLDPIVVDAEEAFIRIDTGMCDDGATDEFAVEVRLSTS